jgi:hypothetical protein
MGLQRWPTKSVWICLPSWLPLFHVGSGPASREQVWKPALRRRRHDVFETLRAFATGHVHDVGGGGQATTHAKALRALRACPPPAPHLLSLEAALESDPGTWQSWSAAVWRAAALVCSSLPRFGGCGPTKMSNEEAFGSGFPPWPPLFHVGNGAGFKGAGLEARATTAVSSGFILGWAPPRVGG